MKLKIIAILITIMMVAGILFSAPPSVDKNIEIMESILNKIIVEDSPILFSFGNKFHGNYYEDFGIILEAESSSLLAYDEMLDVYVDKVPFFVSEDRKKTHKVIVKPDAKETKNKKEIIEEKLNETKNALENFFLNYARSAMDMEDDEKILVNIKIKNSNYDKNPDVPSSIQMSASVKDLKKYYTGKMDENKLKKELVYETTTSANQKKDIEVMQNIFDTFLEKESSLWISDNATDGFYLNGFGAVFTIPVTLGKGLLPMSINFEVLERTLEESKEKLEESAEKLEEKIKKIEEKNKNREKRITKKEYKWNVSSDDNKSNVYVYSTDDGEETKLTVHADSIDMDIDVKVDTDHNGSFIMFGDTNFDEAKVDSILNKTKDDVIKTLSIYGSTLKTVQPKEIVNINLKVDSYKKGKTMSLICTKKAIDDYTNGKIDYNKFVSLIKVK